MARLFGIFVLCFFSTFSLKAQSVAADSPEYKLVVDYGKTLKQLVTSWHSKTDGEIIDQKFSSPKIISGQKTEIALKIFHFDQTVSSQEVLSQMEQAGYRPATLFELLSFCIASLANLKAGEQFPLFPILALGSCRFDSDGIKWLPYLVAVGNENRIYFRSFDTRWNTYFRFLGVHK